MIQSILSQNKSFAITIMTCFEEKLHRVDLYGNNVLKVHV